jgi:hypothetical protein
MTLMIDPVRAFQVRRWRQRIPPMGFPTLAWALLLCKTVQTMLSRLTSGVRLAIFATISRAAVLWQWLAEVQFILPALKIGATRSKGMIMQGGQQMVSFRKGIVFIGFVGLMFGLASMADAAHTKAHRAQSKSGAEGVEMTGRRGKPEMILQGPVMAVSPGTGFIVMRHGGGKDAEEIPIDVSHQATLTRGGKRISIDEVRVGDRIRVSYSGQPGEVSKTVEVMGGPAARRGARM